MERHLTFQNVCLVYQSFPKCNVHCLFEGTHLGLENGAAVIGSSEEEPAEAGPDHEEEGRPPTRPRGQHRYGRPQSSCHLHLYKRFVTSLSYPHYHCHYYLCKIIIV